MPMAKRSPAPSFINDGKSAKARQYVEIDYRPDGEAARSDESDSHTLPPTA